MGECSSSTPLAHVNPTIRHQRTYLIGDIRLQPLDGGGREGLQSPQLLQTVDGSPQTAILHDVAGLIEVDVRMVAQLSQRGFVDVDFMNLGGGGREISQRILGEVPDFHQLAGGRIAAKPLPILHDLSGKVAPDARHFLQLCGIGAVEVDLLAGAQFLLMGEGRGCGQTIAIGSLQAPPMGLIPIKVDSREIVVGNADVWRKLAILLLGETPQPGKVRRLAVDSARRPILIYIADLPLAKSQAPQLRAVGGVGVEAKPLSMGHAGLGKPSPPKHRAVLDSRGIIGHGRSSLTAAAKEKNQSQHSQCHQHQTDEDDPVAFAQICEILQHDVISSWCSSPRSPSGDGTRPRR